MLKLGVDVLEHNTAAHKCVQLEVTVHLPTDGPSKSQQPQSDGEMPVTALVAMGEKALVKEVSDTESALPDSHCQLYGRHQRIVSFSSAGFLPRFPFTDLAYPATFDCGGLFWRLQGFVPAEGVAKVQERDTKHSQRTCQREAVHCAARRGSISCTQFNP